MKNFIRGCGVGILVATLLLAITYMLVDDEISDSEVIARAKKLGMVEADSSVIRKQEATPESVQPEETSGNGAVQQEENQPAAGTPQPQGVDAPASTQQSQPEDDGVPTATQQPQADNGNGTEIVSVTINPGQDGITICSLLKEKGIISDAVDFGNYLSQNGMQMNLRSGTFELTKGMSYEEIVKKIVW